MLFTRALFLFFILLIHICGPTSAHSALTAQISEGTESLDLSPYVEILPDPDRNLIITDIVKGNFTGEFKPVSDIGNSFGFSKDAYWVKFSLHVDSPLQSALLLQLEPPFLDNISFFIPDGKNGFYEKETGDAHVFSKRDLKYRNFLFHLPDQNEETLTYYMRIQSEGSVQIVLNLWTSDAFTEHVDASNFILGLYYGIMLLLMVATIVFFIKIRDKLFIYYAIYLFTYLFFQLSLNGFTFQYLWPNLPGLASRANAASIGIVIIGGLLFSGCFLKIWVGDKHPRMRLAYGIVGGCATFSVMLSLLGSLAFAFQFAIITGIILSPVVLIGSVSSLMSGYRPARYFLAAWCIFLSGVFVAGLLYLGLVPSTFFTQYAMQISSTLEVLLLGYALMDRIDLLRTEKEVAVIQAQTSDILKLIASGKPANKIYDAIALLYESRHPGLRCSMLILQANKLLHGGAPSLPEAYCQAINGLENGPDIGSCGTSTYTGKRVIVEDIETDPKWSQIKDLALQHGLRCCWSEPIKDSSGKVMGAFGMYYDHPAVPTEEESSDLEAAARLAAIVMEREDREKQLGQKRKMEAVGYMAGGMAHNFNNNLAIILGNLELAQLKQSGNPEMVPLLENAKTAVFRSRDLVKQIITYSRQGSQEKIPMLLLTIVNETVTLLRSTLPSTIKLETATTPDCTSTFINADASQMQEIIINLCKNSIQSMDEQGRLKITLEPVELQQKDIPAQYDASPGRYAKLSVQDSGCGIPPQILDKIFDPFFTTKEEFEGAGMGLASVQGIVANHEGVITIDSFPGMGTTFSLYFPVIENSQTVETGPIEGPILTGTERILNVDDDPVVATVGEAILKKGGYHVTTMTNSVEALKLFKSKPDHFDLVITDQTMPNLTGQELIQKVKQLRPEIPVIICTGYSTKIDKERAYKMGVNAFFMKPLDMNKLLQTVRQVLDAEKE